MEEKKFKIVATKKTRYILPNILTIIGVCLGISSIKFSLDQNYGLAVIFLPTFPCDYCSLFEMT